MEEDVLRVKKYILCGN